jgi:transcriptional regulator with XRE-family HTH domain
LGTMGDKLRTIRQHWQLSLREVEERSFHLAQECGDQSYQVSASWLVRLEREKHDLTVKKLVALANIYEVSPAQLLRCVDPANTRGPLLKHLSTPNATLLLTEGTLGSQARYLLPDRPIPGETPDKTTLLTTKNGRFLAPYLQGIIGKEDRTLTPMIRAGSVVHIDTRERSVSSRKDWTHEFQRPIYFFMTRDAYECGWCELERNSEWLTLIPHPLSPASSRRWKYQKEIEILGRVAVVAIRLTDHLQPVE